MFPLCSHKQGFQVSSTEPAHFALTRLVRKPPDMTSAFEGGHGKGDVVREVAFILYYKSVPNVDKGEGVKNSKIFADVNNGSSLRALANAYGVNPR